MSKKHAAIFVLIVLLGCYLISGLTIVQPDEVGVVRRFGAVLREPWEPGLHWGLPWGIDRIDRIKPNEPRTVRIGAGSRQDAPLLHAPDPIADDFLTGDLNLATAECLVQYRVPDVVAFLFRTPQVEPARTGSLAIGPCSRAGGARNR